MLSQSPQWRRREAHAQNQPNIYCQTDNFFLNCSIIELTTILYPCILNISIRYTTQIEYSSRSKFRTHNEQIYNLRFCWNRKDYIHKRSFVRTRTHISNKYINKFDIYVSLVHLITIDAEIDMVWRKSSLCVRRGGTSPLLRYVAHAQLHIASYKNMMFLIQAHLF